MQVRGIVRPVINKDLHLVAETENGEVIVGQHLLTGKEASPISSKIKRLYISTEKENPSPASISIRNKMKQLISKAELICYPMGSFYSSLIANLLPKGVGTAISQNPCLKVYIPNTGNHDPEEYGLDLEEQIHLLIKYLRDDDPENILPKDVLNFVIIDKKNGNYIGKADEKALNKIGIKIIDTPLVSPESHPYIDEKLLIPVLISLV